MKSALRKMENNVTNILIYKNTPDVQKYSLFKIIDWSIGHAVEITVSSNGAFFINSCPSDLRKTLLKEVGGVEMNMTWGEPEPIDGMLSKVIMIVKHWVDEQD